MHFCYSEPKAFTPDLITILSFVNRSTDHNIETIVLP